jgi:hypothetical protein
MRTANDGTDQSAKTTEQDGRADARLRMLVLVDFGPDGSSEAKADEGSDRSMARVSRLPPHSAMGSRARILDLRRNQNDGSTLGRL